MRVCTITGHRPTRFKFKYKENNNGCKRLKRRIREQLVLFYEQGVRVFWVGGALGMDMWAGELLLEMQLLPEYSDLELHIALPCSKHDAAWDNRSQKRMTALIRRSAECIIVGDSLTAESYQRRNRYMVDKADALLAVYDNDRSIRSGTGMTVHYAQKKGIPITLIHPDSALVSSLNEQ